MLRHSYWLLLLLVSACGPAAPEVFVPTEGEDNQEKREAWIEGRHRAAPGVDWREINEQVWADQRIERAALRRLRPANSRVPETFANGQLTATWDERGSSDQAGSILRTSYLPGTDHIYALGAGRTTFRGNLDGTGWQALNDDVRFSKWILQAIDRPSGTRLITGIGKTLQYSDDEGANWAAATGFNFYDGWADGDGNRRQLVMLDDADQTMFYLVKSWSASPWGGHMFLYRSVDQGATWSEVHRFFHTSDNQMSLVRANDGSEAWLLNREGEFYTLLPGTTTLPTVVTNSTLPTGTDKLQLTGHKSGTTRTLYVLADNDDVYRSTDGGATWTLRGDLVKNAWGVGMHCAGDDPNTLFAGAVNMQRSTDGGATWAEINNWADYYTIFGGNENNLHADIMHIASYQDATGTPFTLVANHGGIHHSTDHLTTTTNRSLSGLNVSQYYDVITPASDPTLIYAGSQDQGYQRGSGAAGPIAMPQLNSGDYAYLTLTDGDNKLWMEYPGGAVHLYNNPATEPWVDASYNLGGTDMPSYDWMLPMTNTNDAQANEVYIAGGNINGGSGSYLVKLAYNGGSLVPTQGNFDFKTNSGGGLISAIEPSPISDRLYVGTDNGQFFYSADAGTTWTQTAGFSGPGAYYLYGAAILADPVNPNVVYFAGSGYSNPPAYRSTDGGVTFTAITNGLPNTLVTDLAADPTGQYVFAASDAGPYVYVVAHDTWYPLAGVSAPQQFYYSVQFVNSGDGIVRYATYGRGVWDLNIAAIALPVSWENVAAAARPNGTAEVAWTVSAERNNDRFEVERSADGTAWTTLDRVASLGNTNTPRAYTYSDAQPLDGTSYYRVRQIDYDGGDSYSEVRSIERQAERPARIFPNPIAVGEPLTVDTPAEGWTLEWYTADGKLVSTQRGSGRTSLGVPGGLVRGTYTVRLRDARATVLTERVVVE